MTDMLAANRIQQLLTDIRYYTGPLDGNLMSPMFRASLKHFQSDKSLEVDGIYGVQSDTVLSRYDTAEQQGINLASIRPFRVTSYYLMDQSDYPGATIPLMDRNFNLIANVSSLFFANVALEGSGRLSDGRLINVDLIKPTTSHDWDAVLATCKQIFPPQHVGYGGVTFTNDESTVTGVMTFFVMNAVEAGSGWGVGANNEALLPFKTVASDVGVYSNSDPRFKGKGGLVPNGTKLFFVDMLGCRMPDGSTHDGWVTAVDRGGGIFGAHIDYFSGTYNMSKTQYYPNTGSIYFDGIEAKIPVGYTYGLIP